MGKLISDFNQVRTKCYHSEEVQGNNYVITFESVFYDCMVNEGQAFRDIETYEFPMTKAGAYDALIKYYGVKESIKSLLFQQAAPSGANGELVEGEDYLIVELPDKLWSLCVTQDGDYIENVVRFPDWFPCYRQASNYHYPLIE